MQIYRGIAASPGVAMGEAMIMGHEGFRIPRRFVVDDAVNDELRRLNVAIEEVADEIARNRDTVTEQLGEQYGAIFSAHLQMLRDQQLRQQLEKPPPPQPSQPPRPPQRKGSGAKGGRRRDRRRFTNVGPYLNTNRARRQEHETIVLRQQQHRYDWLHIFLGYCVEQVLPANDQWFRWQGSQDLRPPLELC